MPTFANASPSFGWRFGEKFDEMGMNFGVTENSFVGRELAASVCTESRRSLIVCRTCGMTMKEGTGAGKDGYLDMTVEWRVACLSSCVRSKGRRKWLEHAGVLLQTICR